MKKTKIDHYTDKEALEFHSHKKPGKIEIVASKNMITKRDLDHPNSHGLDVQEKKIRPIEHMFDGFINMPKALASIYEGKTLDTY